MSALTDGEVKQVETIAELKVRQYFDTFQSVLAEQLKQGRHHTHLIIEKHDTDPTAHDGVARRFDRFRWTVHGITLTLGTCGGWLLHYILH